MRTLGPRRTQPASGCSSPTISFTSVLLPVPLSPMMATRSPPSTMAERPEKSSRPSKPLVSPSIATTSSPEKFRSLNEACSLRASRGRSVWFRRSMRFSMEKARLCSLSLPMKAQRCSRAAAFCSCSILAWSFSYFFSCSSKRRWRSTT